MGSINEYPIRILGTIKILKINKKVFAKVIYKVT